MAESASGTDRPADGLGRMLLALTRGLAIFGGLIACAIAALVTVSVTGRYLFSAPVPGDYDVVGILCGCAVFSFLPYCQMVRGNVFVDFFTGPAPPRAKAALDAFGGLLFLGIAVLCAWRLYYGALDMRQQGEVIAAFNFYRWTTIPYAIACMILLIAAIAYTLAADIRSALRPAAGKD